MPLIMVNKPGTGCPGSLSARAMAAGTPKTELGVKQGQALNWGQRDAHPGGQRGGWDPKWHRGGDEEGQKSALRPFRYCDGAGVGAELPGGWLLWTIPFAPPKCGRCWSENTRLTSGCPGCAGGNTRETQPLCPAHAPGSPLPSPDRGWGAFLHPHMQGGLWTPLPWWHHHHDPTGPSARLQNLTQIRLTGWGKAAKHSPLGPAPAWKNNPGTRCPAGAVINRVLCQMLAWGGTVDAAAPAATAGSGRLGVLGCGSTGGPGCRGKTGARAQGYGGAWVHKCEGSIGCTGAQVHVYEGAGVHSWMGAGVHGHRGLRVHGGTGAQAVFRAASPSPGQGRLFWVLLPGRLTCHPSDCTATVPAHLAKLSLFRHLGLFQ